MAKNKKNKKIKSNVVWHQSAYEATMSKKPYYNGYVVGYGAHGDTKYNRKKENRRRDIEDGLY